MSDPKPATEKSAYLNQLARDKLSFDDTADFARAHQGFIASISDGRIESDDRLIWDSSAYDFLNQDAHVPNSVHPGLWRQAQLNTIHGLFEVCEGVWQVRGYDISNLTLVAGKTGWILVDVLTTAATASACLALANQTLGERPVVAVIYTHSHADHFGGIKGVTTADEVAAGKVRIIAPEGFLTEVVNENVIAGPAMTRRALYQFGLFLPPGERGHIDNGLGKALPFSPSGLIAPTETIASTGTELTVDGVRIVFQNTPDAEAPAEMNFWFPDMRLLCMAENCTHNMHNLYPIRGAQTRDALAWSKYIDEALHLWGDSSDTLFATHHWPRFGNQDVKDFLILQRDLYRWIHDQTMRLANLGSTPTEIAEQLCLPSCFSNESHVQGYYGTLSHNAKSVYNKYLGWYDGNPANLNPHPPEESGSRYVEFMGGPKKLLEQAQSSFASGDYRWVAQVVNHLVFADPNNHEARSLQADALEQLGYQSESGTWRNAYLYGAQELRNGSLKSGSAAGRQLAHAMTAEQLFDSLGVRIDGEHLDGLDERINWYFTDLDESHVLGLKNCTINHSSHTTEIEASASINISREVFANILGGLTSFESERSGGNITTTGKIEALQQLFNSLTTFELFAVIEP